jgi:uncharacterized protein (TIGR02646 family)
MQSEEVKKGFANLLEAQKDIEEDVVNKQEKYNKKWNGKYYSDPIKSALKETYSNKCGFCETKLTAAFGIWSDFTVEHYRPKSKYWWLGNEWTNLFPTCIKCNEPKASEFPLFSDKNRFNIAAFNLQMGMLNRQKDDFHPNCANFRKEQPLFLHPEYDEPEKLLTFGENIGEADEDFHKYSPKEHLTTYEKESAKTTAEKFLNKGHLLTERKKIYADLAADLDNTFFSFLEFLENMPETPTDEHLKLGFGAFFKKMKNLGAPDKAYSLFGKHLWENFEAFFILPLELAGVNIYYLRTAYKLFI